MKTLDALRVQARYLAHGFYPARWAHHPVEVRQALRRHHMRPGIKECHANSQRFLRRAVELAERLEYREGLVVRRDERDERAFDHAWLTLDGEVLDLTLDAQKFSYLASIQVPTREVFRMMDETGYYQFVRPGGLRRLRVKS